MVVRVTPLSVSIIETCALGNVAPLESITLPLTSATATACGNAGAAHKTIDTKQSAIFAIEDPPHLCVSQCEILFRNRDWQEGTPKKGTRQPPNALDRPARFS